MNKKPNKLDFRVKHNILFGYDSKYNIDYRISWCGNGQYSHYVLTRVDNHEIGWYVYVNEKDPLYKAIYQAEMIMIYNAQLCEVCKNSWIGKEYKVCHNCIKRERETFKRTKREAELEDKLWETLS
jgi:hypothetical protein